LRTWAIAGSFLYVGERIALAMAHAVPPLVVRNSSILFKRLEHSSTGGEGALNELRQMAWEVFQKLDVNEHGEIRTADAEKHLKQMKRAFEELGVSLKDDYFRTMIADMDEDRSGTVNRQL
jgi:hypothetical protein